MLPNQKMMMKTHLMTLVTPLAIARTKSTQKRRVWSW